MSRNTQTLLFCLIAVQLTGCSVVSLTELTPDSIRPDRGEKFLGADATKTEQSAKTKIANPPARTVRFDGHEIVLGESESQTIDSAKLRSKLEPLIQQQKFQTAAALINSHRETAERLVTESWATEADDAVVQLCASVLSQRSKSNDKNWLSLLEIAKAQRNVAIHYQKLRNTFAEELRSSDPSDASAEQLLQAALKVNHPLVRIDAFRLLGLRELIASRHAWAESQFRQAIEVAMSSGNPLIAADLWLTVAETARRNNQLNTATTAWKNAVDLQLSSATTDSPLDVSFWLLADKTRPESANWPKELAVKLAPQLQPIGCSVENNQEMVLWAAVAHWQLQRGEMQAALVNFKKAETLAQGNNVLWLRIAQAKCLAGMGQAPAASAILSGPAASADPSISAAAMATMGSIKLQSGAYQQGAQLLHKALAQTPSAVWPGKNQSQADLAIAQLIFGDTDQGLKALHTAQELLEKSGERSQLVQSLENELRLLEHEHRSQECSALRARIAKLEQL